MLTGVSLWVLTEPANILGINAILRNRLFLLWVSGLLPVALLIPLALWYLAALIVVRWPGDKECLKGKHRQVNIACGTEKWWKRWTVGKVVYWTLRMGLVAGCLMFTLFVSLEAASPDPLNDSP